MVLIIVQIKCQNLTEFQDKYRNDAAFRILVSSIQFVYNVLYVLCDLIMLWQIYEYLIMIHMITF